ncbi:ATP-binding protein [Romboutsia sedimentorum]|uniref:histidine kinase n=1 Tax=Romboutsia sedimentorum TaxID=1368474 RepID=A0ABT7E6S4_9FIRM|nr:ATP-binding protein [Romboutsia sedimentorum]MDK2562635.1 ATP-binding protein [Romboutsia sedimentorum]MDK2585881.1 ATP-binding protein [Romboutsia sedimentorum]
MEKIFNKFNKYILIVDKQGNIKLCNDKLISKLGYSQFELYNSNINKVIYNQDEIIKQILNIKEDIDIIVNINSKSKNIIPLKCEVAMSEYKGEKVLFIIGEDINKSLYNIDDLEILLDSIQMNAWIKDINGKYLYVNKSLANLAQKDKVNIIGTYDKDLWIEDEYKIYVKTDKDIIQSKEGRLFKDKNSKNGDKRLFETYKAPILDEKQEVKYIIGINRDITLKNKIEKELQNNYDKLNNVNDIISTKNDYKNIQELLNSICDDFLKHLNADSLCIISYNPIKKELKRYLEIGCSQDSFKDLYRVKINNEEEKELFEKESEGIRAINEVEQMKNYTGTVDKDIKYLGTYNIKFKDEFLGLLCISYKNGNKPKFNQDEFIKSSCSQIAVLIKNHRLCEQLKIENKKRSNTENTLELFLSTAADIMGIVNLDGYLKKVTPKWTEVLGWSEAELLSMHCSKIIHKDDMLIVLNTIFKDEISKYKQNIKMRCLCKNNSYIWIDWTSKYIKQHNHFIITGKDITEEKNIEEQKNKLEKAIHLESIKNEFFANISHEFKTPLNIILGSMQLLNQNIQNDNITIEKLKRCSGTIKQNSYRLLRLVNNVIDMSRIDTGYYELQLSNNNIVSIIEDITLSVVNYVENKNISIIFDTEIEEEFIACDPDKIERIMLNLLSNAIKYTDEYGKISVDLKSDNKNIIVSVKDNGAGMPNNKLDIIFDRFGQVNSTLTKKCEGSGIGLSLVKSLIEMHGGSIDVKSEVGKGSEFIFKLPILRIQNNENIVAHRESKHTQIEKCNVEFSDIYNL